MLALRDITTAPHLNPLERVDPGGMASSLP